MFTTQLSASQVDQRIADSLRAIRFAIVWDKDTVEGVDVERTPLRTAFAGSLNCSRIVSPAFTGGHFYSQPKRSTSGNHTPRAATANL